MAVVRNQPSSFGESAGSSESAPSVPARARSGSGVGGSDFIVLDQPKRQSRSLVFATPGVGKTHFAACFMPSPVALINLDGRADAVVAAANTSGDSRRVLLAKVQSPVAISKLAHERAQSAGQSVLDRLIGNLEWAVTESQKGNVKSICLDTGTEYSELVSLATRGRVDRPKPKKGEGDYGQMQNLINRMLWMPFELAGQGDAHLLVLARDQAIWVDNEPSGKFTFRCPPIMNSAVDWTAELRFKGKTAGAGKPTTLGNDKNPRKRKWEIEIVKAGCNIGELGQTYDEEMWEGLGGPFAFTCMMMYPGSELGDWQ